MENEKNGTPWELRPRKRGVGAEQPQDERRPPKSYPRPTDKGPPRGIVSLRIGVRTHGNQAAKMASTRAPSTRPSPRGGGRTF
jgi:hypothetical protein